MRLNDIARRFTVSKPLLFLGTIVLLTGALLLGRNVWFRSVVQLSGSTLSLNELNTLPPFKVGDVVLRRGISADSLVITSLSSSRYSHSGIIAAVEPEVLITHATTDDDAGARVSAVITVPLKLFVQEATALAVLRYPISDKDIHALQDRLKALEGQPFTLSSNPDSIYCTTIIARTLSPFTRTNLKWTHLNLPSAQGDFLFPEAFMQDHGATLIYQYPQEP